MTANEKVLAAVPYIEEAVKRIDDNCAATRGYVDNQLEEKERADREEKWLTRGQRLTIVGLVISLIAALIAAIATLAAVGAFGQ